MVPIPKRETDSYITNQQMFPSQPPTPHPSLSQTQFTHVLSFDQDKMIVVNEVPIEAQRSYIAAREQIQEMTKYPQYPQPLNFMAA